MNPKLIVIDGKTYRSVDEMPPDVRQEYEQAMRSLGDAIHNPIPETFEPASLDIFADKNGDGVPDVLENVMADDVVVSSVKIIVDGKAFDRIEDLPPEARARYQEAMGKLDANRNGVPDFLEGTLNPTNQTANISTSFEKETLRHSAPLPVGPTIEPDKSNGWVLATAGLLILLLCAAGVWYFFLR